MVLFSAAYVCGCVCLSTQYLVNLQSSPIIMAYLADCSIHSWLLLFTLPQHCYVCDRLCVCDNCDSCMVQNCGLQQLHKKKKTGSHTSQVPEMNNGSGISWKDKVSNERCRAQTQLEKTDLIIKERRPKWLGHVLQIDDDCQDKLYTKI